MATDAAIETLVRLGRSKGGLTIEDLSRTVPIERMTLEEVGDLILRVEEAGIPVEIDPVLLSQAEEVGRKLELRTETGRIELAEPDVSSSGGPRLLPIVSRSRRTEQPRPEVHPSRKAVAISAVILVILAVLMVIFLLSRPSY